MSTDQSSSGSDHVLSADDFFEMSLVGTPKDIVTQVERFEKADVDSLIMLLVFRGKDFSALEETISVFSNEVMPSFC